MFRLSFVLSLALVSLTAGSSRADVLPLFTNVPAVYIPGTTFTFQITVPDGLNGLSNYEVGLIFDATVDNPPLTASAAKPTLGYVFPGTNGFTSSSSTGPGPNEFSVSFSDSIAPNFVSTMTGQDVLATITVNPGIDLTGPITVSFSGDTSVTYFSEGLDITPGPVVIDQGVPPPPTVPTPAGWISFTLGALILAGRDRLKRTWRISQLWLSQKPQLPYPSI